MSGSSPSSAEAFPLAMVRRVNEVCNQFETVWKAGQRPRIEDYVSDTPEPARSVLLRELIALDMHYRRRAGEQPPLEEYSAQFPSLDPAQLTDLTVTEPPTVPRAASQTAADLPSIPGYEVLRELGRGGMGIAYQAWQMGLHRLVALKMLLAGAHAGAQELVRFRTEVEAVARLHHPHIVQIHEVGQQGRHPYMALEYVDGGSLAQKLDGTPLPAQQAAQWAETLARAVHYAHQHGIVHRDLTPGNVLLARAEPPEGLPLGGAGEARQAGHYVPKLSDFGLAKLLIGGGPTLTQSGTTLGTPSYMAPEQAAGRTKEIGPASDVYALGAILYELLTGRPPFRAETILETVAQVQSQEPVPPSRLRSKLPRDLTTICLKCLEKQPSKRYATAEALAEDLHRFLAGKPIRARPVGSTERLWRWCRRNPVVATLAGAIVLLLVALTGGTLIKNAELSAALRDSEKANRKEKERLWESLRNQARAGRLSRRMGQRLDSMRAVAEAARLARELGLPEDRLRELRNEAIACLALPDLSVAKEWEGWSPEGRNVDFDAKLERYAWLDKQGFISVRRVADDQEIYHLAGKPGVSAQAYLSPDGQILLFSGVGTGLLQLWRLVGSGPSSLLKEEQEISAHDFSPDSRQLAVGRSDGSLDLYELASGQRARHWKVDAEPRYLAFHPTRQEVAVAFRDGFRVYDLDTGNKIAEFPLARDNWPHVAWHPDGKTLGAVGGDRIIYLWDVATRKQTAKLEGFTNGGISFTFNHAGDLLASNGWEAMLRLWDPRTGKQLFSTQAEMRYRLRFSLDDRFLGTQIIGNKLRIWEVVAGREYRTLVRDPVLGRGGYHGGAFRSDGRLLAVGAVDGFGLWDAESGKELRFLPLPAPTHVLFEPSGALLTHGPNGLWRWPVQTDAAFSGLMRVGPPQRLALPGINLMVARSRDGSVIASSQGWGAYVLHTDRPQRLTRLAPHQDVRHVAVSPDGRWVATGSHGDSLEVKVWDAKTGELAKELFAGPGQQVAFSPNGLWLAASGDSVRVWEVGSWRPVQRWEGPPRSPVVFSPDSKILAFETGYGFVRLVDPARDCEYARLEEPNQDRPGWLEFSPDASQLVTTGEGGQSIHIWDLRAIRQQLAELDLDWDLPPYEPANGGKPAPLLQVKVELGNAFELLPGGNRTSIGLNSFLLALNPFNFEAYWHRGDAHVRLGETQKAVDDYSMALACLPPGHSHRATLLRARARLFQRLGEFTRERADLEQVVELDPEQAEACNNLAWLYLTGPEELRDPPRALTLAKKAVELTPREWLYLNTLGVAYYRQRQYEQAIETLERSLRESKEEFAAYDLFFLAMSHAQRGESAEAKRCLERAVRWVQEQQGKLPRQAKEELDAIRAEAEALLPQPPKY